MGQERRSGAGVPRGAAEPLGLGDDGVLAGADAGEQAAQDGCERERDGGDCDEGEDGPEEEGVPLPLPELAGESDRVLARRFEELPCGQRHGRGVEDAAGEPDEGDDQQELDRIDDVVAQLRSGNVEAEEEGEGEAEEGGAAEDGVDADQQAGGETPGEVFRCGSHAQEREDGKGNAAVDPVVMDGGGVLAEVAAIWLAVGVHG